MTQKQYEGPWTNLREAWEWGRTIAPAPFGDRHALDPEPLADQWWDDTVARIGQIQKADRTRQ